MKKRQTRVTVTDHAVIDFLENECGLDVPTIRRALADQVTPAAAIGAVGVTFDRVRLRLNQLGMNANGVHQVHLTGAMPLHKPRLDAHPHAVPKRRDGEANA